MRGLLTAFLAFQVPGSLAGWPYAPMLTKTKAKTTTKTV